MIVIFSLEVLRINPYFNQKYFIIYGSRLYIIIIDSVKTWISVETLMVVILKISYHDLRGELAPKSILIKSRSP
jgi:hypothetical protein